MTPKEFLKSDIALEDGTEHKTLKLAPTDWDKIYSWMDQYANYTFNCIRAAYNFDLTTKDQIIEDLKGHIEKLEKAKDSLAELCQLKKHKDDVGTDYYYLERKPIVWQNANEALNNLITKNKNQ